MADAQGLVLALIIVTLTEVLMMTSFGPFSLNCEILNILHFSSLT